MRFRRLIPFFSVPLLLGSYTALVKAMAEKTDGQSLKEPILVNRPYEGLQQALKMDKFGDSRRDSHFVVIQGTEFIPAK